jgi:uncharacterized protein (TIGR02996 family)
MTEEDTFIRTICDSPGDDTHRLVYADWLDERDDPRGPYLRAEAEWAKSWWAGEVPGDDTKLRALGAKFDSVWTLRLTRPPLGVCCSHLNLAGKGLLLTPEDLATVEEKLDHPLPVEYRAFLLNHNQALGTNARGQHPETGRAMIFRFFPVNPAKMTGNGSYSREFGWWDSPNSGDDPSVQIGIFGKSGNCVLLVGQRDAGETVSERHTGEVCYETLRPQRQWRLAKSLPAFLTMLRAK